MAGGTAECEIDHIGIAVSDLDGAEAFFGQLLGVRPAHREEVAGDGIQASFFDLGHGSLELIGATEPDSSLARFLSRRGPGLHHVAYRVADLEKELRRWRELGAELIDEHPRPGARGRLVAFIQPRSALGVLTELCQLPPGSR
ncbi:MAG: methylmalonyl-CoA epimerase [Candidatus Dormibacteria bacterium]